MRDPYRVLGVDGDVKLEEIKAAFKVLARACHPDLNPDDPTAAERFKEVNQAHQIVGDPEARALWDEFGEESLSIRFNPEHARRRNGQGFNPFTQTWTDMERESSVYRESASASPQEAAAARAARDKAERESFEIRSNRPWRAATRVDPGPFGAFGSFGPKGPGDL